MDPNLLAMFARGAQPGQPPPSMMPPGMPGPTAAGFANSGVNYANPMQPQPPAATPNPQASMPGPTAPPPGPPPIDPSRVIRPVGNPVGNRPAANAAMAGRGGDSIVAHMTPGEIAVPPEVQTPEVLATLNRAFAQMHANPTSFQAGHPDQKINPETGMPEFGWFDVALPLGLGLAGSMFLGPEMMLPALEAAGIGAGTAAVAAPILGGALGSTAGNLITGKPIGESLARGAISGVGAGVGGAIGDGASSLGGIFGSGPAAASEVGPSVVGALGPGTGVSAEAMANLPGGGLSPAGLPLSSAAGTADFAGSVAKPSLFNDMFGSTSSASAALQPNLFERALSRLGDTSIRGALGSGIGGMVGNSLADSLYPPRTPSPDLGPPMGPPGPISSYVGGGSPALSGNGVSAGAPRFPGQEYLSTYGRRPAFNYFPTG